MTGPSFVAGMARLETFFKAKLEPRDRLVYQDALCGLSDEQWSAVVSYAEKAWKYTGKVPAPAQFLEWAGVKVETPAEAAQRTLFDGTPVVEGTPLSEVFRAAEERGAGPVSSSFWKSRAQELAYQYATEEVLHATPMPKMLSPEWIFGRLRLICSLAEKELTRMERGNP